MPSLRVTVALNKNQSSKTPLLFPSNASFNPNDSNSVRALIVKTAQSKLRLKKVIRIFVSRTGQELCNEEDWKDTLTRNDVVLLVSAGEDYVGLRKENGNQPAKGNAQCPVVNLAKTADLDSQAVAQLELTACQLPGIVHAVGQPDLHPGNKYPIGAVFVSKGWIHPPLIGGDIGCGMAWYRIRGLSRRQVDGDKGKKIMEKLRGLEGPWRTQACREAWLTKEGTKYSYSAGLEWDISLGTIGAGNHFAELQVVEQSSTGELVEDEVVLLVHSGSRGYGGDVLKRHASDDSPSFPQDSDKTKAYLEEHERACEWAKANRDLIALRFLACLEPGEPTWQLDDELSAEQLLAIRLEVHARKVVDIWHNNVEKVPWPPSPPSQVKSLDDNLGSLSVSEPPSGYAYIHRKGAAPTYDPYTGVPLSILPLPGSRGTPTLILRPRFSQSTTWGLHNALSLAHGAGRSMSRAKALASLGSKYKDPNTLLIPNASSRYFKASNGEDVHGGTWVICDQKELVWEEAPEAYKNVYAVADDLVRNGVAAIVGWCRPLVSYKIRKE